MYKKLVVNMALWQAASICGKDFKEADIERVEKCTNGALMFFICDYVVYISDSYISVRDRDDFTLINDISL